MLIKPAYETDAVWDTIRTSQPLGLWWIGSALKEQGHEVRLLDETVRAKGLETKVLFERINNNGHIKDSRVDISYDNFFRQKMTDFNTLNATDFVEKYSAFQPEGITRTMVRTGVPLEKTLKEVASMNPDYVGIPVFASCNYIAALELARAVKETSHSTSIVMGGQHITALFDQVLEQPYVDHVITGDAVLAMSSLVNSSQSSARIHGGIQRMDEFPLLDMDIMAENIYPQIPTHTYKTFGQAFDYMFSKGCFRNCEFCVAGERANAISTSVLEKIDEQLQRFKDAGIEEIIVQDDAFLFKPQQNLNEYLKLMKNHGLNWQDNGGIEFEGLTPTVMKMFSDYQSQGEGRINSLYVPLNPRTGHRGESAIVDMRNRFESNFSHVRELRDQGIYVCTSEIIGYPGQTTKTMQEDIALHQELVSGGYADKSMTFVTSTLPGTKLYRENAQHIVDLTDWPAYSNFVPQSTTDVVNNPRYIEELTVKRNQRMNEVQVSYAWGSSFPNA